jgi:hypothetical protein
MEDERLTIAHLLVSALQFTARRNFVRAELVPARIGFEKTGRGLVPTPTILVGEIIP